MDLKEEYLVFFYLLQCSPGLLLHLLTESAKKEEEQFLRVSKVICLKTRTSPKIVKEQKAKKIKLSFVKLSRLNGTQILNDNTKF